MPSQNRRANHRLNHQNRRHIQFAPILEQLEARRLLAADLQLDYQQPAAAWYARWNHETLQAAAVAAGAPTDEWFSEFVGPRLYQRNDWIVRLTSEATQSLASIEQAKALLNQNNIEFQIVAGLGLPGLLHVHTLSRSAAEVETSLATNSRVASFAANDKVGGQVLPNDSDFGNMTGLNNVGQFGATSDADIDAPEAWDTTRGSPSVIVGVVDSGIDATHPDLYLNIWLNQGEIPVAKRSALTDTDSDSLFTFYDLNNTANAAQVRDLNANGYIDAIDLLDDPLWADGRDTDGNGFTDDFFGWNFRTDSSETFAPNNPSDVLGHGTHVAGTIGAIGNNARGVTGINWRSSIMALKFLDENNQGDTASAIAAVNYATMMRTQFNTNVRVLNNSWGQPGGSNIALKNTIEASGNAGILFVAAAGNGNILGQGVDNDRTPFYPASYELDNVIAVGASDGNDRLAGFSNYGLRSVDIVAPGVGIRSTLPGGRYGEANGTSMATPHVSGSAALVWSLQPEASVAEIRRALLEQGDILPALGSQISTSRRLNANRSLAADVFAPTVQLFSAANITTAGGTEQLITVKYKNRLGVDKASLGNNDLLVTRQAALDETLTTTFVSSTENPSKTEVTAIYRLNAVGGTWDAEDYGNYLITAKSDAARSLSGLASRETAFGSFQVKIAAAGIFYVDTFLDTVDASVGNGQARDSAGRTSLRAAIQEANALKPQPVKIFLQTGTYPLTIASVIDAGVNYPVPPPGSGYDAPTGLQWSNASSGDLDLQGNITLVGLGVNRTTIDAAGIDRVLKVYAGATVSITGLTLTGGKAPTNHSGGAILNSGNLSLDLVTIKNNEAMGGPVSLGGGIAHWNGNLNVYRSTVDSNQAIGGGGVFVTNGATAKIDSSALSDNFTDSRLLPDNNQFGGGALLTSMPGRTQVINSTLADNQAFGKATGDAVRNIPTFVGYDILFDSAASRDGRYAVYSYRGASLVDSDYFSDVFVLDLSTGISEIVSVNSDERKINSNSLATRQSISADGRYVIFESDGSNIDSLKTRDRNGIYLRDRQLGTTRRLGTSIDGKPIDGIFGSSTISSNGKFATFFSDASNLVPGDTPGTTNIFFLDLETFLVEQIDVSFDGVQSSTEMYPNLGSNITFTSDDGRFVLFTSDAGNLVQGDNNRVTDVFIRDRKLKTTTLVSHALNSNSSGNNQSGSPLSNSNSEIDLSSDGRWVVYTSSSTNLVPGTTTPIASVYLYDATTGVNTLISRAADGSQGNGQSIKPRISSDASKIVYLTLSNNIVAKPTINTYDAVIYDVKTGTSSRIPISGLARVPWSFSIDGDCENLFAITNQSLSSQDKDGYDDLYQINLSSGNITLLSNNSQNVFSGVSSPVSDQSGATIAYASSLGTQVPGDTNNLSDVFVYDRTTNARKRISTGWDGSESNGNSSLPTISADGNVIAFRSTATNLVPNDINGVADIFVFDRKSNLLTRLLVGNTSQSDINSFPFALSGDGKSLLLESTFSGYVVGDSNSARDVFVCDIATGTLRLVSRTQDGTAGNLSSSNASISFDGRFVSFVSDSSNLVDGDTNGLGDVFRADLSSDVIQRISLSFSGGQVSDAGSITSGASYRTSISGDGRFVAFKSMSAQIAMDDVNTFPDVFLYDGKEKKTLLVSSSQGGIPGSGESGNATLSMDGKFLAFTSTAADIPSRGVAFDASIFVFSRDLNYTEALGISSPSTDDGPQGIVISPFSSSSRFIARSGRSLLEVDLANREISAMTQFVLQDASVVVRSTTILNSRADEFSGYEQTISGPLVVQESILPEVEAALTPSSRTLILPTTVVDSVYASWKDLLETTNETGVKSYSGGVNSRMYRMGNPLMRISLDQHGSARKVTPDIGSVETVGSRVSGEVYVDADRDSQKDLSENRPSGFIVFLDANHNGIHDPGELASVTGTGNSSADQGDGQGSFVFEDVPNGQYAVVVSLNGSVITNSEYPIESLDQFSPIQPVSISGDGRFVAFASAQANLVIGDRNRKTDIFVVERATGILRRVSVGSDGLESDGDSSYPSLSYDGSVVAFHSAASNLVDYDTNGFTDTFIRDLKNSTTVRVNTTPTGGQANGPSLGRPILSQLGDSVAFISSANNLAPEDVNTRDDWFVRNLSVNSLERIQPIDSAFRELPYSSTSIENASFSGDLSKVVFISGSSALVSGDTNNVADVFLLNRSTQIVTRVSVHSNGEQGNGGSGQASISLDGKFVAFTSMASNLIDADIDNEDDLFLRDMEKSLTTSLNVEAAAKKITLPQISANGRFVLAKNGIFANTINGTTQVVLIDTTTKQRFIVTESSLPPNSAVNIGLSALLASNGESVVLYDQKKSYIWQRTLVKGPKLNLSAGADVKIDVPIYLPPGAIRGTLFEDTVRNSRYDKGEPTLASLTVFLDENNNSLLDPGERISRTDEGGAFQFIGLEPEREYVVRVVPIEGFDDVSTSNSSGWRVYLSAGANITERDFGFVKSTTGGQFENAVLTGKLFNDLNSDGLIQNGEVPLVGVTVYLDLNGNEVRDFNEPRAVTDNAGSYSFTGLGNRPYTVRTLLGTGTVQTSPLGTKFATTPYTLTTGSTQLANPQDVIADDINGDGWSDLAVALFSGNSVAIRLNDKAGGFGGPPVSVSVAPDGLGPIALASGNFNSGSAVDMISANQLNGTASILLDFNGTGFASKQTLAVGETPTDVVVGRFDADADFDAIVANQSTDQLTVLVNNGSGVFSKGTSFPSGGKKPTALVTGLFNNDAFVDIAVANYGTHPSGGDFGNIAVLLGRGDGTFQTAVPYTVGFGPISIATDDFNGDGFLDLVSANFLANTASLLLGSANGTFTVASEQLATGQGPLQVQLQDIEGDGDKDILVTNLLSQTISVLRNRKSQGGSGFEPAENFGVAEFSTAPRLAFAAGDFDKSSTADIAIINSLSDSLKIMRNTLVNGAHRIQLTGVENVANLNFGTRPDVLMPRMDPIDNPESLVEDAPQQTISLNGIALGRTGGPALRITASSANTSIIPNPTIEYVAGATTGFLRFTPARDASGQVAVTVTARDAGADKQLDTADDAVLSRVFTVSIKPVNDAPTFDLPTSRSVTALEDSGGRTVNGFISNITSGGGSYESSQTLSSFLVVADNLSLFSAQPVIDATGTLRFTPSANAVGTATVTVTLTDNGDTDFGGTNRKVDQFVLTINPVNDAPSINIGGKQTVLVGAAAQTVLGFATGFAPGGGTDENSQVVAGFVISVDKPDLFSVLPVIDGTGTLRFTPSLTRTGIAKVSVQVRDDGGSNSGGIDLSTLMQFDIEVAPLPDTVAPTPTLTSSSPTITNVSPIDLTVDFGEAVTGFALTDLVLTNGIAANLVDLGAGKFTISINATADGDVKVSIPAAAAKDLASNNNLASTQFARTVDRTAPTPAVTSTSATILNQNTFDVAIDFAETVSDFVLGDLIVTNGTAASLQDLGSGKYSATITATADGATTVRVPSSAGRDRANNNSLASLVLTRTIDTKAPSVVLSSATFAITNVSPIDLTVDFGEAVTGFGLTDFLLTNATASNLVDLGAGKFTVSIAATADGELKVSIPAASAKDLANNNSLASTPFTRTVDRVAPVATITTSEPNPTNKLTFPIEFNFGEAVSGFDLSDLVLGNCVVSNLTETAPGRYVATLTTSTDGVVLVGFSAGVARDAAGNVNTAPAPLLISVNTGSGTYKPLLSTSESSITPNRNFTATIDFGRIVTGFVAADLELSNASATISDLSNGRYQVNLSAVSDGTVTFRLPADRVRDANNRPNEASDTLTVRFVDTANSDFGDAPTNTQSGFANSYPTRLIDNGAFHKRSALFLGTSSDAESDGQPNALGTGDDSNGGDDENGILFPLSNVIGLSGATSSSFIAIASASGFLDAWIDFNRDGDWSDAGEQIATKLAMTSGSNSVAFAIPSTASAGTTFARFRLSTAGGLGATGPATDGEVEDHAVTFVGGATKTVSLNALELGGHEIAISNGLLVVSSGNKVLWSAPASEIAKFTTLNDTGAKLFEVSAPAANLPGTVRYSGSGKPIELVSNRSSIDLAVLSADKLYGVQLVDLRVSGIQSLTLRRADVLALNSGKTLRILMDQSDTLVALSDWKSQTGRVENSEWVQPYISDSATIEVVSASPWQNEVKPTDVDGDQGASPLDVLELINQINANTFPGGVLPTRVSGGPQSFYDPDGDGRVGPLDVLMVINELNRVSGGEGERSRLQPDNRKHVDQLMSADLSDILGDREGGTRKRSAARR